MRQTNPTPLGSILTTTPLRATHTDGMPASPSVALVLQQWEGREFVRSGLIVLSRATGTMWDIPSHSYMWSITVPDKSISSGVYYIDISGGVGLTLPPVGRYHAFPLRCLSTTAVGTGRRTAKSAFPNTTKK